MDTVVLIKRCKQGDELAWEMLVRRYQSRIYSLAYHYVHNAEEAHDLAQEIFIKIFRKLAFFEDRESFVPWMLLVARNCCIDFLRRRRSRPDRVNPDHEPELLESPHGDAEQAFTRKGKVNLLQRALRRLTEQNQEMILLKEIQGLTLAEVAEMLNIPLGTAKSRSNRARIELAKMVQDLDPRYGSTGRSGPGQEAAT